MELGVVGLGRMGSNMVQRLLRAGHRCVVYDLNPRASAALVEDGALAAASLDDLAKKLAPPRHVWLMVPAAVVDATLLSARAAPRARRRCDRRREFVLPRRHPPRRRVEAERHPLSRRRNQRRRVGRSARLLPDDRRRRSARSPSRSDFCRAGTGGRCGVAHAGPRESAAARPSMVICTAGRAARATSSRWSTTASSTESWRRTPKA